MSTCSPRFFPLTGLCLTIAALALAIAHGGGLAAQEKDPQIKASATATAGKIDKDGRQLITIKMQVDNDWHAYANPVQNETFEPNKTLVKITGAKKLEDVSVSYPQGKRRKDGDETYYIYEGSVDIQATVKRAPGDTGPLEVIVKFVTCSDKLKKCLPPASVKLEVK